MPDCAEQADVLFSAIRLLMRTGENNIEKLPAGTGRTGYQFNVPKQNGPMVPIHAAWWVEGKHFVFYAGTMRTEAVIKEVAANAKKGGVTGHPLYPAHATRTPALSRWRAGSLMPARVVDLAKSLAGPSSPALASGIDDLGLGSLKAAVFNSGFDGKESRAIWEFDLPGERKGLAKVLKQQPLGLADLPPMPPDVSRFSALRVDPTATYDAGIMAVEALTMYDQSFGGEDDGEERPPRRSASAANTWSESSTSSSASTFATTCFPTSATRSWSIQSPTEGLSAFGTVVCVSLKDPAKIKIAADRLQPRAGDDRQRTDQGPQEDAPRRGDSRTLLARLRHPDPDLCPRRRLARRFAAPASRAGIHPPHEGRNLATWKPDAATAARLAKMPADGCGLQYCRPDSTAQNLCCVGPLAPWPAVAVQPLQPVGTDYDPIDVGLIPNGHELSKHLFPNLTITRDDGKTVQVEVNESFSLPGEAIGLEPIVVLGVIFGFRF